LERKSELNSTQLAARARLIRFLEQDMMLLLGRITIEKNQLQPMVVLGAIQTAGSVKSYVGEMNVRLIISIRHRVDPSSCEPFH
jgi:hypothetical protein